MNALFLMNDNIYPVQIHSMSILYIASELDLFIVLPVRYGEGQCALGAQAYM